MAQTKTKKVLKTNTDNVVDVAPVNPIEQKLDRIIELLEGTLQTKAKGIDFSANPWWDRFLEKE